MNAPIDPKSMDAEIISIGDEMTSGARLDTNSQWLSLRLGELGYRVLYHTTVGDQLEACIQVFKNAIQRVPLVIATGGLGPTADDLTRDAIAQATGCTLQFDADSFAHIEQIFARRGRPMPPQNRVQAEFPAGATIIPNPQGTAPGFDLTPPSLNSRIIALPGVPAEMTQMWLDSVAPRLRVPEKNAVTLERAVIKCFGLGESEMESLLGGMISRDRIPQVGITVSRATISLRIEARSARREEALRQVEETRGEIMARVGPFVFGEGEDYEIEDAVVDRLRARRETLEVLELGFDAPLMSMLAKTGANDVFFGGRWLPNPTSDQGTTQSEFLATTSADWFLVVDAYPLLAGKLPAGLPRSDVTLTLYHRQNLEQPSVFSESIGGHPDILTARIAKTALAKLLQCLAST